MVGVVNDVPVPKAVPPLAAAYQLSVEPGVPVAASVAVPVPQMAAGVVVRICGSLTVTVTVLLCAPEQTLLVTIAR